MRFEKGHDPRRNSEGRPKGSRNKRTLVREALQYVYGDEKGFWITLAQAAKEGCPQSAAMIANRLIPILKSQLPEVEFDLPEGNAADAAAALIEQAASGELSPDHVSTLINALAAGLKIYETEELEQRIALLEKAR